MTVAVFGLGIIGSLWAQHYETERLLGASWNRTAKPAAPRWQPDPVAAAQCSDVLHLVVADPPAVQSLLERIVPVLRPTQLVVQSSTIDPQSAERFCGMVRATGARYVEAPFTGSKPAAESRTLVYYLGGRAEDLDLAEPYLAHLSRKRLRLPEPRQAAALKLSMNLQIAMVTQSIVEGLSFARHAGLADETFFAALESNVVCSGLVGLKKDKLLAGDWSPQFSTKHLLKDVRLALGTPGAGELPGTSLMERRLALLAERGWSEQDFSALLELL